VSDNLVLLPEVEARRILRDSRIRLQVLAPYGSWTGRGTLRVLRLKTNVLGQGQDESGDAEVELIVGYESYQP
jgi:hypothetical protein